MMYIPQLIFLLILVSATFIFTKRILIIRSNILLGQKEYSLYGTVSGRLKNMFLLAFGQKKMFKKPIVAIMHLFVYVGFVVINIELLEIVIDGLLGTHRIFVEKNWISETWYHVIIDSFEVLALLVLVSCVIFLIRRNIVRIKRLANSDLKGWPKSDANYILCAEIILMSLFLIMNATDTLLRPEHGVFLISGYLQPLFASGSAHTLEIIEQTAWWLHILGILAFLNYLPFSKHLHILLAFPNAYFARTRPLGTMSNMPNIQQEVLYAMKPELAPVTPNNEATQHKFGAKDVFDLSWKNLLDAYSCTECGRCSAACPANITGKKLSPRLIMMKTRDRMEAVGKNISLNKGVFKDDGENLLNHISVEELRACTTCNACVEECPVSISPLEIILEMRRSLIMEDSNAPQEWNAMFGNIENNFAPWKFAPDQRDNWVQ
ncbi:MAG: (Fe-S)-binding protein [Phycisphaerales bacterium]|nr:(Fe-S)-binding protein [Phycisphaerales bacterium]